MDHTKNSKFISKEIGTSIGLGEFGAEGDSRNLVPFGSPANIPDNITEPKSIKEVSFRDGSNKTSNTLSRVVEFMAPYWHDHLYPRGDK